MEEKILRDKKIDLRLTAQEKEQIKAEATARDMSTSEFIRYACERLISITKKN